MLYRTTGKPCSLIQKWRKRITAWPRLTGNWANPIRPKRSCVSTSSLRKNRPRKRSAIVIRSGSSSTRSERLSTKPSGVSRYSCFFSAPSAVFLSALCGKKQLNRRQRHTQPDPADTALPPHVLHFLIHSKENVGRR